jgi:hypothetical protein
VQRVDGKDENVKGIVSVLKFSYERNHGTVEMVDWGRGHRATTPSHLGL